MYCIPTVPMLGWPQVTQRPLNTGHKGFPNPGLVQHQLCVSLASGWTNGNENEAALQTYTSAASHTSLLDLLYREALWGANTAYSVRTMSVPNLFHLQRYNCIFFFL